MAQSSIHAEFYAKELMLLLDLHTTVSFFFSFFFNTLSWKSHSNTMAMCSSSTLPLSARIRLSIKCYVFGTSQQASPWAERKQARWYHLALEPFSSIDIALLLLITSQRLCTNRAKAHQAASILLLVCLEHFLALQLLQQFSDQVLFTSYI